MTEIQCTHCKHFKDSEEFFNRRKTIYQDPILNCVGGAVGGALAGAVGEAPAPGLGIAEAAGTLATPSVAASGARADRPRAVDPPAAPFASDPRQ